MPQLSLFDTPVPSDDRDLSASAPLAARLRPLTLDEYVGQKHLVGPHAMLRQLIESDHLSSMIFWGPPGVGKPRWPALLPPRRMPHSWSFPP